MARYRRMWLLFAVVAALGLPALVIRTLMLTGVIDTLSVRLETPADGAVIYASTLTVAGVTEGVGSAVFVEVVPAQPSATFIGYRDMPAVVDGRFVVQFVPSYDGPPIEMQVRVFNANDSARQTPKAAASFVLASVAERPDGAYIDILMPAAGDPVGGDEVGVRGRASGLAEGVLTVELVDSAGAVLDSQTVRLAAANPLDDVPWQVGLKPNGGSGSALVRVRAAGLPEQVVPVVLSDAAG